MSCAMVLLYRPQSKKSTIFSKNIRLESKSMNLYEKIKELCKSNSISISRLETELGFGNGSIRKWGKTAPAADRLQKVADYFHVSTDYLLGREDKLGALTEKDEKDIAKTMDKLKKQLMNEQGLMFDGELLDEETTKLLLEELERQERIVKAINKKYIPKKYR